MNILYIVIAFLVGVITVFAIYPVINRKKIEEIQKKSDEIIKEAEKNAEIIKQKAELESKELKINIRKELEEKFKKETKEKRDELSKIESRIIQREERLDKKQEEYEQKFKELNQREERIKKQEEEIETTIKTLKFKLEETAKMTEEEAKKLILSEVERNLEREIAIKIRKAEEEIQDVANKKAKEIISQALQRVVVDHVNDTTVSVVNLPSEEMKGRIIGREGRNIRALEASLGINIIIDDTPEAVVISGFNNIRREIARIVLERLIADGRIHPARIEEMVEKVKKEMDTTIKETGKDVIHQMGLSKVAPEIVTALGKLNYRTSYGQNVLKHSIEVAQLAAAMAAELKCDVNLSKRAGLLHDIGKAIDQDLEGTHTQLGAEIAKRAGESEKVINAILSHHEEVPPSCVESVLVAVADSISAARFGARHESIETYIKRLEQLEQVATEFKQVDKAYAIQAGREIRVIVKPDEIDDTMTYKLAHDISKKIEENLEYPGEIKVIVIREVRATEYAR